MPEQFEWDEVPGASPSSDIAYVAYLPGTDRNSPVPRLRIRLERPEKRGWPWDWEIAEWRPPLPPVEAWPDEGGYISGQGRTKGKAFNNAKRAAPTVAAFRAAEERAAQAWQKYNADSAGNSAGA
jgi:hypothetical protein